MGAKTLAQPFDIAQGEQRLKQPLDGSTRPSGSHHGACLSPSDIIPEGGILPRKDSMSRPGSTTARAATPDPLLPPPNPTWKL